ncbi:sulfur carrier protein ThiS [Streptomyces sp. HPF1205]|uniref:sulfur carrier protein ThiS n=1 Tax=Streptomyces sp. HPF1205 TaxID=2873262 RepID=UPI001CECD853|nr:sulfur carrier protein ThiS [Streptomyces sp. HPF1205]
MTITVQVNGESRAFDPPTALGDIVACLTSSPSGVAAALNETVVPRGQWPTTEVRDGDRVEVLTAVQGG